MKKKKTTTKKLGLAKETVRTLGKEELTAAQGGTTISRCKPCFATDAPSCRC